MRFRIEFNPSAIGSIGFSELHGVLTSIMPGGWDYVIEYGRISRIDIAVDIPEARPGMFAVLPKQGLSTKEWTVAGKLQTLVLGKKGGNQTLIYNKKAQQLGQGKPWEGKATVRVERRMLNPAIKKLSSLPDLPNPFAALSLTELLNAPPTEKEWLWSLFKDSVSVRGLPAALARLPKAKRTLYRKHLESQPHQLWGPSVIWTNWLAALGEHDLHKFHHQ
ncbi:hypothetical protein [Tardiphaga robiniae]|uniref:hypothetical protein n=1 Tax=Tardiphaga robiniae TaxID=943830 RepID=UPI00195AB9D9|nr:hypothetical protein [Tardiphaga robiniae]